jgi:hypothetical protein
MGYRDKVLKFDMSSCALRRRANHQGELEREKRSRSTEDLAGELTMRAVREQLTLLEDELQNLSGYKNA